MPISRGCLLAASLAAGLGCGPSGDAKGSASAVASTPAPPPPAVTAAPKPADDIDVAPLEASLKCPERTGKYRVSGSTSGPCRVLGAFVDAKGWSGVSPGGEGRFLGRLYAVKGGKIDERYAVLRTRNVPSNEAGPGRVPARLALTPIATDDKAASAFEKAIKAFERKDVPAKGAPAFDMVKELTTFTDLSAMPTASGRVVMLADDHTFFALGAAQEILLVAPKPTGATNGDGTYAVLYPMSW